MTTITQDQTVGSGVLGADIKVIPEDGSVRARILAQAAESARSLDAVRPPSREDLEAAAEALLERLALPHEFLGFAMVAVDNAYWAEQFAGVPTRRRLLLLPKCLSDEDACQGIYDSVGLTCAECGGCEILGLKRLAEGLSYQVVVAEGTSSVVMKVLEGDADAIIGVACLDSLEKSFARIADLGIPHQAIPLLSNGCKDTTAELDLIRDTLTSVREMAPPGERRTYIPLLRETQAIFRDDALDAVLEGRSCLAATEEPGLLSGTDVIARDWLKQGGKRLRPFTTIAAYAVGKHGLAALRPDGDAGALLPPAIRKIAVAIEALHKASLVHDDIEDKDPYRYGQPTLHQRHGIGVAINVGDYLVGLGYDLIGAQADELGAETIADILRRLSTAHLQLCCGQGTELLWDQSGEALRPIHALQIGALKTAPAFEIAIYAGLRAAGAQFDAEALRSFAMYVGEGFQVMDDLDDWDEDRDNSVATGLDALSERPAILRAFALEACGAERLAAIRLAAIRRAAIRTEAEAGLDPDETVRRVRELYHELGAFAKAEELYARLRGRALAVAGNVGSPALQELMEFLARNILRDRTDTASEARG